MDEKAPDLKAKKPALNLLKNREKKPKKGLFELSASVIALIVVLVLVFITASGFTLDHISRENPNFCASCHVMTDYVDSYLTSKHLDNVHSRANIGCKDCHSDYTIPQELASAAAFVSGNYKVPFEKITVKNDMCLQCHISEKHMVNKTDFLPRNPHNNHNIGLRCTVCHVSHGDQIDFCSECHDNGGQRMIEDPILGPRSLEPLSSSGH